MMCRFLLACVSELVALTAGGKAAGPRQNCEPPAAVHAARIYGTYKPRSLATEPAWRPVDRRALLHITPILAIRGASVFQRHRLALRLHVDRGDPLALPGPDPREPPRRPKISAPMP